MPPHTRLFAARRHGRVTSVDTTCCLTAAAAAGETGATSFGDTSDMQGWLTMHSKERADDMAEQAREGYQNATAAGTESSTAAAAAALTQLWQYHSRPEILTDECSRRRTVAYSVLFGLGLVCRVLVLLLVRSKVARKAQE